MSAQTIAAKQNGIDWLARVFSHEPDAIAESTADEHLFDRLNDFGMQNFVDNFRPLNKFRQRHGNVQFAIGAIEHDAEDLCHVKLVHEGVVIFVLRIRFEETLPCRIKYWGAYPPLPDDVSLRPYRSADAPHCVRLEQLCPMQLADGTEWTIDRHDLFDDYLQLMAPIDAWVVVHKKPAADTQQHSTSEEIVGFFSSALRPINFAGEETFAVYQHHYRVHPNFRGGSVSQALACAVDTRRSFEKYNVQFPYSLIDPSNTHMTGVGFPPVPEKRIVRLALPAARLMRWSDGDVKIKRGSHADSMDHTADDLDVTDIVGCINRTHQGRVLFSPVSTQTMQARWSKVASFNQSNYRGCGAAVAGVWFAQERNVLKKSSVDEFEEASSETVVENRLSFVLDYGYIGNDGEADQYGFLQVLASICRELVNDGGTHLCLMCDTRSLEYEWLKDHADDIQTFAFHTLPWLLDTFQANTVYCDGVFT